MACLHRLFAPLIIGLLASMAAAQHVPEVDLSGFWEPVLMEDYQTSYVGPDPLDYTGLPINAAARARGLSYSDNILEMPERLCMYYGTDYLAIGPFGFRISAVADPTSGKTLAWRIGPWIDRPETVIWMDGRAHPRASALHTAAGFTTGAWQGHTLTTSTTHLRESPLRRNGIPRSDEAGVTMHLTRHGDYLELTAIITDPVYLTEPLVLSRLFKQNPKALLKNDMAFPCDPREAAPDKRGVVPNYLPGKNPLQGKFAARYGLPLAAAMGGAETMYPEYRHLLAAGYKRPTAPCGADSYCCAWGDARNPEHYIQYAALGCPGRKRTSPEVFDLAQGKR